MRSISTNSFFGLVGFVVPTAVVFVSYPVFVSYLGATEFGVYLIATSVVASLSFMDIGITAATVFHVASLTDSDDVAEMGSVMATSVAIFIVIGSAVTLAVYWSAPVLAIWMSGEMAPEAVEPIFRVVAFQFVPLLLTNVSIGYYKGRQLYEFASGFRIALSVGINAFGAIVVALFGGDAYDLAVTSLVVASTVALVTSAAVTRSLKRLGAARTPRPRMEWVRRLAGYGAAMSVHSMTAVAFSQVQKLAIGVLIGPAAVTVFVVAHTAFSKAHAAINAVTEVVFPFASSEPDVIRIRDVYVRMLLVAGVGAGAGLGVMALLAEPLFTWWIGPEISREATLLAPYLAIAFFFVSLTPAPFHLLNGIGRPWTNVAFDVVNIVLAVCTVTAFYVEGGGLTLVDFAMAYCLSNVVAGIGLQLYMERSVWTLLLKRGRKMAAMSQSRGE